MLPKRSRLKSDEVQAVLSRGIAVASPGAKGKKSLISMKFLALPGPFKSAVVAPKSLVKSAVGRNRVRRAVYRAVAETPPPHRTGHAIRLVREIPKSPLTPAYAE